MASNRNSSDGRIELAIQAFKNENPPSVRELARIFDIPRTSLRRRLDGSFKQPIAHSKSFKLTSIEEESLLKWIVSLDMRGTPPRIAMVRDMAGIIIKNRTGNTAESVGKNWVTKYIKRHPIIASKFLRKYDYRRAKCEDPKIIQEWFNSLQTTIAKYGIAAEDIYNFDETGFAMGQIGTAKVLTRAPMYSNGRFIQLSAREWVTVIECINTRGILLPAHIIFKGKVHLQSWYQDSELPEDWSISISDNGWTTDAIGLYWLKNIFIPYTKKNNIGQRALLVMDGHGSHCTPQFDELCAENNIITICMPAHSSHILQPLDICCFGPLKQAYGDYIQHLVYHGKYNINKLDFLQAYSNARNIKFTSQLIKSAFKSAGIEPFQPEIIYSKLSIIISTPSPAISPKSISTRSSAIETPHNVRALRKKESSLKKFLGNRSQSPPTPSKKVIAQVFKGAEMAMHGALLLAEDNKKLRAIIAGKHKRKKQSRRQLRIDSGTSIGDAIELINSTLRPSNYEETTNSEQPILLSQEINSRKRAPIRCSICKELGHRRNKCTNNVNSEENI